MKVCCSFVIAVLMCALVGLTAHAAPFYQGQTIRIIVGTSPGGGFDAYARFISRHMGRHIPGNPTIIVENMPGAGGVISANHLYKVAKGDGLTIGHFNGGLFVNQAVATGQTGFEFDARKFIYLGAAMQEYCAVAFTKASGITSVEKWRASPTPVKMGGIGPGNGVDNSVKILKAALGLPIQLVSGYKGSSEIRLAAESGELAGGLWLWDAMRTSWGKAIQAGSVAVVLQLVPKPFADLPNVPLAISLAKTDEARRLIDFGIHTSSAFVKTFLLPPGTPADRVQILRKAFEDTLKDPQFRGELEKAKMGLDPVSGEELERSISKFFGADPGLLAKLKEIIL